MAARLPLWLDCDPGHDDVFAILMACESPYFDLVGVSTVHGNSSLDHTTKNALSVLTAFKKTSIPVYPGAEKPLTGECRLPESIHGKSGLDGTDLLPEPMIQAQAPDSAVPAIIKAINEYKGDLIVVATGALTNIAGVIQQSTPEQLKLIKYLSLMGGAIDMGNWTPYAEFNIWADVIASEMVFSNDILKSKTIIVPLNITHKAIVTPSIAQKIRGSQQTPSVVRQMLFELIQFFTKTYEKQFEFSQGPPLHDPLAIFVVLHLIRQDGIELSMPVPDIGLDFKRADIKVVQEGEHIGETVPKDSPNGTYICYNANFDLFWKMLLESLNQITKA